jgi:adenylate cyclase
MQRKLTVIFSADVVGYSALMERDEAGTLARLKENRKALFDPAVAAHGGRIFKLMGDGVLIEFSSAASAVICAIEIQRAMEETEASRAEAERLRYRIGINLGDVIIEGDDIYGEGVNVAARIQALAPAGGVAVARNVSEQVAGKIAAEFDDQGQHAVKNIERPVHVFTARAAGATVAKPVAAAKTDKLAICVLPFANMSGESEQEYFADGISEDIITDLSKVSALSVISRNSAFMYKGKHVDLPKVARELKVSHVLEGSVRKSGNRVRITAQLILAATNDHIWADRYDRDLNDIFALQDEISEAIVKVLRVKLLPEEKKAIETRGTDNVEAYSLHVEARQYVATNGTSERFVRAAVRMCERAVALDPDFAEAWATLGRSKERLRFETGLETESGEEAAARALRLNDRLASAHAVMSLISNRNGRTQDAEMHITRARELDPDDPYVVLTRASAHFRAQRYGEALPWYERAATLDPSFVQAPGMAITCAKHVGDKDAASRLSRLTIERCEAALARNPDSTNAMSWLVPSLMDTGQGERARYWINRALMFDPDEFSMRYNFACALCDAGDFDMAMDMLETGRGKFSRDSLSWMKIDPDLKDLRTHPRYLALIAELDAKLSAL